MATKHGRYKSPADYCRKHGFSVGDRIVSRDKHFDQFVITAIGEDIVLVKWEKISGMEAVFREVTWTHGSRIWRKYVPTRNRKN